MSETVKPDDSVACVVAIDVDKRQRFLFETDKLREMLGASRLLDTTKDVAQEADYFGAEGLHLFAPVSGELRVWARKDHRASLLDAAWKMREWLHQRGIEHTCVYLETKVQHFEDASGDLQEVHREISSHAAEMKHARPGGDGVPRCSLFAPCAIHGHDAANSWNPGGDQDEEERREQVGFRAKAKLEAWKDEKATFYKDLLEDPILDRLQTLTGIARASISTAGITFNDLSDQEGKLDRGDQYIAFLCADGDGMGNLLNRIDWNKAAWNDVSEVPWERNRAFSVALDTCIREALGYAIAVATFPDESYADLSTKGEPGKRTRLRRKNGAYQVQLPLLPQVCGGEDVWVVADRECAFLLARAFAEKYAELVASNDVLKAARTASKVSDPLTMSVGIAFAKAGHPAHAMVEAAEDLVKEAKKRRKDKDPLRRGALVPVEGCVDWYWIESSLSESVLDARAQNLVYEDAGAKLHLTTLPWTMSELKACENAARKLQKIARRKREQLETILRLGLKLSRLAWESWWHHLNEDEQSKMKDVNAALGDSLKVPDVERCPWLCLDPGAEADATAGTPARAATYVTPWLDLLRMQHVLGVEGRAAGAATAEEGAVEGETVSDV